MTGRPSVGIPPREVSVEWQGAGLLFEGRAGERPPVVVDGDTQRAMSPMELLLLAAGPARPTSSILASGSCCAAWRSR
jgi:hypothetical protein